MTDMYFWIKFKVVIKKNFLEKVLRNIFGINHERLSQKLFLEKAEAVDQLFNQIVETMAGRGSLKNTDSDSQFFSVVLY